jgi:hypothetical protein
MVMRACVIYDKYWALFLGRPTSIKNQDIGMDLLSRQFSSMLASASAGSQSKSNKSQAAEIYDQLVELMDLAGRIVEVRDNKKLSTNVGEPNLFAVSEAEDNAYMHVINLDRQLQNWYRRLPEHLTWKPANIKTAPFSFFLLHQQYHVSMILLHRPWAKYRSMRDDSSTNSHPSPENVTNPSEPSNEHHMSVTGHALGLGDPTSIVDDSRTSLSRSICTQQAIRVSRIFWQHSQRFSGKKICVTGIQHAGTAAIALIAALTHQQNESDRRSYLGYLEVISHAIHDMSETYHPAERMDALLNAVITQFRNDLSDPYRTRTNSFAQPNSSSNQSANANSNPGAGRPGGVYSVLPQRRENPDADQGGPALKKRLRPTPSRRASEYARPPPPFSTVHAHPTPPGSSRSQNPLAFELHHSISGMFSGLDPSTPFNLDSLQGSAVDMDTNDDAHSGPGRASDDYVLVSSSAEGWGVHQGMNQDYSHAHQDANFQMSDWVTGPAGLSATTVLGDSGHGTMAGETAKNESSASMEWMGGSGGGGGGGDDGLNALSPISLGGLVQSVEKAAGAEVDTSNAPPRNHELDFFSF